MLEKETGNETLIKTNLFSFFCNMSVANDLKHKEATAWYNAIYVLEVPELHDNWMIRKLQQIESCRPHSCKTCEFKALRLVYEAHLQSCDGIPLFCDWCCLRNECFDCRNVDQSKFAYCETHWSATKMNYEEQTECACKIERDVSNAYFMRKFCKFRPVLEKLGWQFITNEIGMKILTPK